MNIYFVRHGQSESNAGNGSAHSTTNLSIIGSQQVEILAARLKELSINVILSSNYARARQTAEIINKNINLPIYFSDILIEENGEEENFEDLKNRAIKALEYIISYNSENVLVVGHAKFLKMIFCIMLWGEGLTNDEYLAIRNKTSLNNAGITWFTYNREDKEMYLVTMNDLAHLNELITS